ncbi:hypothetical protein D6817_01200 [Candidatus Pacearchaeota archaeon]|nr:MAG: hypothetical protein D6817_01200 [Candidatus Pacearchaeota archaeon]
MVKCCLERLFESAGAGMRATPFKSEFFLCLETRARQLSLDQNCMCKGLALNLFLRMSVEARGCCVDVGEFNPRTILAPVYRRKVMESERVGKLARARASAARARKHCCAQRSPPSLV